MARVAKAPGVIPTAGGGKLTGQVITLKGKNGELTRT
ncbi:50S ribosomal protein L6, partial [Proteus mirabilis]